jgi:hypothetical protein
LFIQLNDRQECSVGNSLLSSHNDRDADEGDDSKGNSTKTTEIRDTSQLSTTLKTVASSAVVVNKAIDPHNYVKPNDGSKHLEW